MNDSSFLSLWGLKIPLSLLSNEERDYLRRWSDQDIPSVDKIWKEMDRVWEALGLDNRAPISEQNIKAFYSHPVWLLNGIFVGVDNVSRRHRESIAKFITSRKRVKRVADYGGGIGELAKILVKNDNEICVDIIEPFPSRTALSLIASYPRIRFVSNFDGIYDCVVAQDVLEHLDAPVQTAKLLAEVTRTDGLLIFANCFFPVIRCHLPSTFHLRHTFPWIVQPLGMKFCGRVEGAEHALIFQKIYRNPDQTRTFQRERISRIIGLLINALLTILSKVKKSLSFRLQ